MKTRRTYDHLPRKSKWEEQEEMAQHYEGHTLPYLLWRTQNNIFFSGYYWHIGKTIVSPVLSSFTVARIFPGKQCILSASILSSDR